MRRMLLPAIVVVYALGAVVALGHAWSGAKPEQSVLSLAALDGGSIYSLKGTTGPRLVQSAEQGRQPRLSGPVEAARPTAKSDRSASKQLDAKVAHKTLKQRFEAKRSLLSRERMVVAFETAGIAASARAIAIHADPAPTRFAAAPVTGAMTGPLLAFADPEPSRATDAFSAIDGIAPDEFDIPEDDGTLSDESATTPDYDDYGMTPDDAPLPGMRPRAERREQPEPEPESPAKSERAEKPARIEKPEIAEKPKKPAGTLFAFAKPNDPSDDKAAPKPFKNFFNRPKAGNGVAVYDISAAKVYMPDGSVLEAHSGIGKMVDNPRYVHVKMNGPTPPHTYNLTMRERRFHGVEAIRMTPVSSKGMHGRTGILAHSYLLRGGRAESHGCVAFKDYPRFLKAFKAGKVRQLVVVPGGGRGKDPTIRVAKNGRDA